MMSVMMVMMMSVTTLGCFGVTILFMAMLFGGFELKGCVCDAVLCEFLANGFLNMMRIAIYYCVEGCIVVMSIHAPNVYVVNVLYAFDVTQMLANFLDFDAVRRFFEEKIDGFF